jgi:hypothetical protein
VYLRPAITDYGDLVQMTNVVHPLLDDAARRDLSFSSQVGGAGATLGTRTSGTTNPSDATAGGASGGGAGGGTGGGGAGGGGGGGPHGSLPFTGFASGLVAAVGAGFTAAGYGIRRLLRPRGR